MCSEFAANAENSEAPTSRQHFDIWQFATSDKTAGAQSYFGAVPPQVIENLLWFFTEHGDTVVDLFAGSGTTVDVAKAMGRRVSGLKVALRPHPRPLRSRHSLLGTEC